MKKREPIIIGIFALAFISLLIISFYYGIIKYWQSFHIGTLLTFLILFNYPILIGLLYFLGVKIKKAHWISFAFSLIYGTMVYIIYNKQYNDELNNNPLFTHGVIIGFNAYSEGEGYRAKVSFIFNNSFFESEMNFKHRSEFNVGDSVIVKFSRIHPTVNETIELIK